MYKIPNLFLGALKDCYLSLYAEGHVSIPSINSLFTDARHGNHCMKSQGFQKNQLAEKAVLFSFFFYKVLEIFRPMENLVRDNGETSRGKNIKHLMCNFEF